MSGGAGPVDKTSNSESVSLHRSGHRGLDCKCSHPIHDHRDVTGEIDWLRYDRGHCLVCECCVYRPERIVNK